MCACMTIKESFPPGAREPHTTVTKNKNKKIHKLYTEYSTPC